tara:strand:+ start:93 stop:320 length:228 start_codon:yes stop_codon:yes gene_type:complete
MNERNKKELWKLILKTGDYLKNKLPHNPSHPNGRNSYAHISLCIKNKFGLSYKDINDDDLKKVIEYIDFLKKNST